MCTVIYAHIKIVNRPLLSRCPILAHNFSFGDHPHTRSPLIRSLKNAETATFAGTDATGCFSNLRYTVLGNMTLQGAFELTRHRAGDCACHADWACSMTALVQNATTKITKTRRTHEEDITSVPKPKAESPKPKARSPEPHRRVIASSVMFSGPLHNYGGIRPPMHPSSTPTRWETRVGDPGRLGALGASP